jgi:hypothetical protein
VKREDQKPIQTYLPIPSEVERIGEVVIDSAFQVHSNLGPGLMESLMKLVLRMNLVSLG